MDQVTVPGRTGISVTFRRSARARRISLRVSSLDGRVTLTLPQGVSAEEGRRFVSEKADWIADAVGRVPDDIVVSHGTMLPVHSIERRVVTERRRGVVLTRDELYAPDRSTGAAVRAFLKVSARDAARMAIDRYSRQLGRKAGRLSLRDTRSRWGSCSSDGNIMLSWRLILAPEHVLDYVAAHEVAHLERMDHSADFWAVVASLRPDWKTSRDWLRQHGGDLHRFRFDPVD